MVDPITLTGLALGVAGGLAGSSLAGSSASTPPAAAPTPPPAPVAAPAAPATSPLGAKGAPKPEQPTFLGAAATPPTQSGQKSLLGQ